MLLKTGGGRVEEGTMALPPLVTRRDPRILGDGEVDGRAGCEDDFILLCCVVSGAGFEF